MVQTEKNTHNKFIYKNFSSGSEEKITSKKTSKDNLKKEKGVFKTEFFPHI